MDSKKYKRAKHNLKVSVVKKESQNHCECCGEESVNKHNSHLHTHDDGLSCGCCDEKKNRVLQENKNKSTLSVFGVDILKICVSLAFIILGLSFNSIEVLNVILFVISAIVVGYEIIVNCIKNIVKGNFFDENTLMLVASITAFILGEHFEGAFIVFLFSLGEMLESIATLNSRKKIVGLSALKSQVVHLIDKTGEKDVLPDSVKVGSLIQVKSGERVPIDGILLAGTVELDMKAITGESNFYSVSAGGKVYSGAINVGNPIVIKTQKVYKDSTVVRIILMVEGAMAKKAKSQKFITSFAKVYTPIIAVVAVLIALVPPIFDALTFTKWIYKALSFLVVSCPCALVISVPLAYFVGIGSLAKKGVLVKGSNTLEMLANTKTVVYDKTGTVTKGEFTVSKVEILDDFKKLKVIENLISIESKSNHPISKAIVRSFKNCKINSVINVKELTGLGLIGEVDGKSIAVGNKRLMNSLGVEIECEKFIGTIIYLAENNKLAAKIYLIDDVKDGCRESISKLRKLGVTKTYMISGDKIEIAEYVSEKVGIEKVYADKLPEEKLESLKEIKENSIGSTIYVGDGINDTPSIALADVGVAMGGLGSEVAIDCADVVIMDDDLRKLPTVINQAKRIRKTVVMNIVFSLGVKFLIMLLSVITSIPVWVAMFGDVGVMLLAVLNSLTNSKCK